MLTQKQKSQIHGTQKDYQTVDRQKATGTINAGKLFDAKRGERKRMRHWEKDITNTFKACIIFEKKDRLQDKFIGYNTIIERQKIIFTTPNKGFNQKDRIA